MKNQLSCFLSTFFLLIGGFSLHAQVTITVTNANDAGAGSLRQAIIDARAQDTIAFDPALDGDTIFLQSQIELDSFYYILGNFPGAIILHGRDQNRIFEILERGSWLRNLVLQNGRAGGMDTAAWGGAILSRGQTTLDTCLFRGNTALENGGAVASLDIMIAVVSTFLDNTASGDGGAVYNSGDLTVTSLFADDFNLFRNNSAGGSGGAIANYGEFAVRFTEFTGNSAAVNGGAIYNGNTAGPGSTSFLVDIVHLNYNTAGQNGGAIANEAGLSLTPLGILDPKFRLRGNHAGMRGGAIWSTGAISFIHTAIDSNEAVMEGGGVFSSGGIQFLMSSIDSNSASRGGGLFLSSSSPLNVSGSTINNNEAALEGGGIWKANGSMTLGSSSILGNSSGSGGGGIFARNTNITLTRSTVGDNTAGGNGGGIASDTGQLRIIVSTVAQNSGSQGGGIYSVDAGSSLLVDQSTISFNKAINGGGIYKADGIFGIRNTILAGNVATGSGPDYLNTALFQSGDYNLIGNESPGSFPAQANDHVGTAAMPIDPRIDSLGDNGGPTLTMLLQCNSPAFGGGNPDTMTADQRNEPVFGVKDIGSLERQSDDLGGNVVWYVTSLDDAGPGTLRDLINGPRCAGDTIRFDPALNGDTILLDSQIIINRDVVIIGNSWDSTIVDGQRLDRIFTIDRTARVEIHGMRIQNGLAQEELNQPLRSFTGGGIWTWGTLILKNSKIAHNEARNAGGLYHQGVSQFIEGQLLIEDCVFEKNKATVEEEILQSGLGGGLVFANLNRKVNIYRTTFHQNHSAIGGGMVKSSEGEAGIFNSTFSYNRGDTSAGGLLIGGGLVSLDKVTVYGNRTIYAAGGISVAGGTLVSTRSTISRNIAEAGGGIVNESNAMIFNTIVAANSASFSPDYIGTVTSTGYNLIGADDGNLFTSSGDTTGTTANPLDPRLDSLRDNGGPTMTAALLCGSPAYNGGNPDSMLNDQRGIGVFFDTLDIGAFESQIPLGSTLPSKRTVTNTDDDGLNSLRFLIRYACPGDTICFDPLINGETIKLDSQITIDKDLVIIGNGTDNTLVDGQQKSRLLQILAGSQIEIWNLSIQNGTTVIPKEGGGIYNSGNLVLTGVKVINNTADISFPGEGGGIYNVGVLVIVGSSILQNRAGFQGGGIFNSGQLNVTESIISSNYCNNNGGGGIANTGALSVIRSTIAYNRGDLYGGGILHINGGLNIQTSTIAYNTCIQDGGGIQNYGSNVVIQNSTIAHNTVGRAGGGINNNGASANIAGTILAQNSAGIGDDFFNSVNLNPLGQLNSVGYNLIGNEDPEGFAATVGDTVGNDLMPLDPLLDTLGFYGGPTLSFGLLCNSPALDAGNPANMQPDQRNLPVFNGIRDIGSFERQQICDPYCDASGNNQYAWISLVAALNGGMSNSSGADPDGYGDYRHLIACNPNADRYYFYFAKAGMFGNSNAYWRVWIDWDNSETFEPWETVIQKYTNSGFYTTVFIPSWIPDGQYRMRVSMNLWSGYPEPCGNDGFGEYEDYTVCKGQSNQIAQLQVKDPDILRDKEYVVELLPNPVEESLQLNMVVPETGNFHLRVLDARGLEVLSHSSALSAGANQMKFSAISWQSGLYFVEITSGGWKKVIPFVKI